MAMHVIRIAIIIHLMVYNQIEAIQDDPNEMVIEDVIEMKNIGSKLRTKEFIIIIL